jgi:hypothetical protein
MQTFITKGQFKSQLASLLDDINKIHWTDKELDLIINESLMAFGAFGYFKDRGSFVVNSSTRFYDINNELLNQDGDKVLERTATFGDVIDRICYDLLESKNDINVFNVFNQSGILTIIDRRLDEFKLQTGLILSVDEFNISENKINLGNEVLDFIRLAFKDISDDDSSKWRYYKLNKEDEENLQYFKSNFNINPKRYPKYYSRILGSANNLAIYPPFENTGKLHLIEIRSRDKTLTLSTATKLDVPNNFLHYIKYGVEEDLFKMDTPLQDLPRASYCAQRWKEGIITGKNYSSVLNGEINGINSSIITLEDLDNFDSNWQNATGIANKIVMAGYNLLLLNKTVTEDVSIILDVICNARIPISDVDYIDVKAEYIEMLLNYCYHIAMFKEGFLCNK